MPKYIIMPEGSKWSEQEATSSKTAYCLACSWINPSTRTAVLDPTTGNAKIYTRELEPNGNLKQVIEH